MLVSHCLVQMVQMDKYYKLMDLELYLLQSQVVAEVEEIGKTFETVGLPRATCTGGAEMFQLIADSPLGEETVENRQRGTTLEDCAAVAADYIAGLNKK